MEQQPTSFGPTPVERKCALYPTAYCFRFINNARSRSLSGPLLPEETAAAERYWIKATQRKLGDWKEKYEEMRREKWKQKERQFKIGDIVLMVDENVSRGKWNLARLIEVFPGKDGVIRNVKLKTKSGEYKRSVHKCCPILEKILPDGGPEGCFEHLHKLIHLFIFLLCMPSDIFGFPAI